MCSSRMGSMPRGAASSTSPPGLGGLVEKSLLQSRARNGRAEGSRAQCLGANLGESSRCEFSQRGSPAPGGGSKGPERGTRALPTTGEKAQSNDGAGQGHVRGSGHTSPGTATVGKSKPRFAARTCSCRSPSPDHRCRGGDGQGSVLEMSPVHQGAFPVP